MKLTRRWFMLSSISFILIVSASFTVAQDADDSLAHYAQAMFQVQQQNDTLRSESESAISQPAAAQTYTVNSTADLPDSNTGDGLCETSVPSTCTLRAAIEQANSNSGTDTIAFNIPGAGPHTIQPLDPLPFIDDPIIIDGTTQPGYAVGSPQIVLNGSSVVITPPLTPEAAVGINILSGGSTVRGLVINGFAYGGIGMPTGSGNTIEGNFIGVNAAGTAAVPNLYGVIIVQSANNIIGGTTAAARNIISGNNDDGVNIFGPTASNNQIIGNAIGADVTGTQALGNGDDGVKIEASSGNRIGGTTANQRNLIAANANNGVILKGQFTSGNVIQGNAIGTDFSGTLDLGNGMHGVFIEGAPSNTVGGTAAGAGNLIAFNDEAGIAVTGQPANRLQGNSIFSNGGPGIDLGNNGVTPNDAGDGDGGANNLQNYPALTAVEANGLQVTVRGTLSSRPSQTYRVEFFANTSCDPSNFGEGQIPLGAVSVSTNSAGSAVIAYVLPVAFPLDALVTATATSATGDTSEFSQCQTVSAVVPAQHYFTAIPLTLSWNRVSWAKFYEIQIDGSPSFTNPFDYSRRR